MKDLIDKALVYQEFAATKSNAYYAMADYCRTNHMRLGVIATTVSTLVGTAVFAGLATQLGSDGNQSVSSNLRGWTLFGYVLVALFSISAPVLTGLQTLLKFSEQAEKLPSRSPTPAAQLRLCSNDFLLRLRVERVHRSLIAYLPSVQVSATARIGG